MENWAAVEADFAQFYQTDPLDLMWRRFLVLLSYLPADSRVRQLQSNAVEESDPWAWKHAYDRMRGVNVVKSMTVAEYLGR